MGSLLRILIVDDDPSICKALALDLSRKGVWVETAGDGKTGIQLGSCNRYDILITDLMLQDINGFEVIRQIRRCLPEIVLIIITGNANVKDTVEALRLGVFDFLEKPFAMQTVRDTIARAIEKRNANSLTRTKENNAAFLNTQMIVHQINNPLSAIMGSAYLAMTNLNDAGSLEKQMNNIVKSTFEVAQISRRLFEPVGNSIRDSTGILLQPLLDNCIAVFDDLFALKGIQYEKDFHCLANTRVPGDAFCYEQIIKNLISNAIDAMTGSREKRLTLKAAIEAARQPFVSITLTDTGCGIPSDCLKDIFVPGHTSKPNGSGLGLYVVETMAKKMNCQILCESRAGIGTTFALRIPFDSARPHPKKESRKNTDSSLITINQ
jgi:signal transduction histidine kinase